MVLIFEGPGDFVVGLKSENWEDGVGSGQNDLMDCISIDFL